MICATRRELKSAFGSHYSNYEKIKNGNCNTRRLLLFYSVECGLKTLLLKNLNAQNTNAISRHNKYKSTLAGKHGHNIEYLLKELHYNNHKLPNIKCNNLNTAKPYDYNQVWRYGVRAEEKEQGEIELKLLEVVKWIQERI